MKLEAGDVINITGVNYVICVLNMESDFKGKTIFLQLMEEELFDDQFLDKAAEKKDVAYHRMQTEFDAKNSKKYHDVKDEDEDDIGNILKEK